jgi:hypothetical protein
VELNLPPDFDAFVRNAALANDLGYYPIRFSGCTLAIDLLYGGIGNGGIGNFARMRAPHPPQLFHFKAYLV